MTAAPAAAKQSGKGKPVEVGPIWNQMDANRKCPDAARARGGTWTGQWWTTKPGQMSVCEIAGGSGDNHSGGGKRTVDAGPIWNQIDAQSKCPKAAKAIGAEWTGQWWTTKPGQMSVCEIKKR
jgi:rubredoxin